MGLGKIYNILNTYDLRVFLQRLLDQLLVVHFLVVEVIADVPPIHSQDETIRVVYFILIENWVCLLWRERVPLVLRTESQLHLVLGRTLRFFEIENVVRAILPTTLS